MTSQQLKDGDSRILKKGAEFRPLSYSVAEFNELSDQADELKDIIFYLWICFQEGKRYADFFNIDADGTVRRKTKV